MKMSDYGIINLETLDDVVTETMSIRVMNQARVRRACRRRCSRGDPRAVAVFNSILILVLK